MKKRILFIGHDAGHTGAVTFLLHLLRWLKTAHPDVEFAVILRRGGALAGEFEALAPTLVLGKLFDAQSVPSRITRKLRVPPGWVRRARRLALRRFCRHQPPPDLVYVNTGTNGQLVDDVRAVCGRPEAPVITHLHEMEFTIREVIGHESFARVLAQTDRYVAASEAVRRDLLGHHPIRPEAVEVVHEFIPATAISGAAAQTLREEFRARWQIAPDAFVVGACGQLSWRKGTDLFVPLLVALRRRLPSVPVCFAWIGCDPANWQVAAMRYEARQAGAEDALRLIDIQSDPSAGYAAMDVFALVSREDPFPLVCLEAAMLARPIVCFADAGGMPEFVEVDSGVVAPFLDLDALADALARLFRSPTEREQMGVRAAEKVRARHEVSVAAPQVWSIIARSLAP